MLVNQVVILDVGLITCLLSIHYQKSYAALMVAKDNILFCSYIRHIKQYDIAFWDTHWNISKETTLSNDIHNNSTAEMIPAVDFDTGLQSSLDEFSEETFDKLEEEANP